MIKRICYYYLSLNTGNIIKGFWFHFSESELHDWKMEELYMPSNDGELSFVETEYVIGNYIYIGI